MLQLAEWVDQGGRVSDETAAKVAEDCEKMACEVGRQGKRPKKRVKSLESGIVNSDPGLALLGLRSSVSCNTPNNNNWISSATWKRLGKERRFFPTRPVGEVGHS